VLQAEIPTNTTRILREIKKWRCMGNYLKAYGHVFVMAASVSGAISRDPNDL
jgi:hypothetical protein